jgi:hypothetical protein
MIKVFGIEKVVEFLLLRVYHNHSMRRNNIVIFCLLPVNIMQGLSIAWPTYESPLVGNAKRIVDDCIQPTESGKLASGKFGLVRENGKKFHEGIDIKSFIKAKDGNPADTVCAFMDGTVVYINANPNASSYGRYIVMDHGCFLTLYAHLGSVCTAVGRVMKAGEKVGVLGTSSNCTTIPNSRAHVHFEIDFPIGDDKSFATWYAERYSDKNVHGRYNGYNLIGVDPISSIEKLVKGIKPIDILVDEKEAATVQVVSHHMPEFVKKYAQLFARHIDLSKPVKGWRIQFSWFGLPMAWTPIYDDLPPMSKLKLISYRKSLLERAILRNVLGRTRSMTVEIAIGARIGDVLGKMGFDVL